MKTTTFTKEQGKILISVIDTFATVGKPQMRALNKAINAITTADNGFIDDLMTAELQGDGKGIGSLIENEGKDTFAVSLEDAEYEVLKSTWDSCGNLPAKIRAHVVGIDDAFEAAATTEE
jgi:hypothetical protein